MIRAYQGARQNVVLVHDAEREVRLAAHAHALLLAVQAMPVRSIVGQGAKVRAPGRVRERGGAVPQAAILRDKVMHQLDGERRQADTELPTTQSLGGD